MTNLHYLLIGLALLLVGGVMLYNYLQERRLRKQIDGMFQRHLDDASIAEPPETAVADPDHAQPVVAAPGIHGLSTAIDESQDTYDEMLTLMRRVSHDHDDELAPAGLPLPEQDADEMAEAASAPAQTNRPAPDSPWHQAPATRPDEPRMPAVAPAPAEVPRVAETIPPSPLDPQVECVARLRSSHRAKLSYAGLVDGLRRIGKPVRAYALGDSGVWQPLSAMAAGDFSVVEVAVQLVDRKGPISQAQLEGFCNLLYEFAAERGGAVTCPDLAGVQDMARELDTFCMAVDMLIGLNLVAPEGMPFLGKRIDDLARAAGMTLTGQGVYVLEDAAGHSQFSLVNQRDARFAPDDSTLTTPSVSLLFDVPNIADGLQVFDRMTTLGFDLARALGGRMMDDQGHLVTQSSLQSDRQQLAGFYARMQAYGIPAGSERARRLFA